MKNWTPIIILILAVTALCVWDGIYTKKTFTTLNAKCEEIYNLIKNEDADFNTLNLKVENVNAYWTKHTDILCISISRKDLQPISDYLQYLASSIENKSLDDCLTYARLLDYNVKGLSEAYGISFANLF